MLALRFIGCFLFLLAAGFALVDFVYWHTSSPGGHNLKLLLILLAVTSLPLCFLGVGLLLGRKSAASIVALGAIAYAVWLITGSLRFVPMPWTLINIAFAFAAFIPACVILKNWHNLKGW